MKNYRGWRIEQRTKRDWVVLDQDGTMNTLALAYIQTKTNGERMIPLTYKEAKETVDAIIEIYTEETMNEEF